ncbi:MAG: amidohydrolase family protein [Polyangiaceae bacterium]
MPRLRSLILAAFALAAPACGSAPPTVAPTPTHVPPRPPPPRQARTSVSGGWETKPQPTRAVLIENATVLTAAGSVLEGGSVLMKGGKITAVARGKLGAPEGAEIIDGRGKFVTPGIIDSHSHLGVYAWPNAVAHEDGNEMTDPVFSHAQAVDAFWPEDPGIERAVAGGVTAIQVLPGSGNLIGGRAVTVKLRHGHSGREMHMAGAPDGLKMACGENPKRVYGEAKRTPMSRMGNLALQRAAFLKAQKLQREWAKWRDAEGKRLRELADKRAAYEAKVQERAARRAWCDKTGDSSCDELRVTWEKETLVPPEPSDPVLPPDRDPGMETLAAAMEGRVLVHVHCYRADDMLNMLALGTEVGFTVRSFHHALEAYKIRDTLANRGVSVSTWADWWGFKMEAYDGIPENAGLVHEAGGRTIIHSDSAEGIQRLNQEAAKAMASAQRAGVKLTDDDVIKWVTANPAWALGIDARTGTLEPGKDADVVLWDAHPLSARASAERVWIDGAPRFSKSSLPTSDFELGQPARSLTAESITPLNVNVNGSPKDRPAPTVPPAPVSVPVRDRDATKTTPAQRVPPPPSSAPIPTAAPAVTAIVGATLHTGTGDVIEDATLIIDAATSRIVRVGKSLPAPPGAGTFQARGMIVTPGLVDLLTSVGLVEVSLEKSTKDDTLGGDDRIRAAFRAADGYNPASTVIGVTRAEGVTSVGVIPAGGLISGQSAWADLDGTSAHDALARAPLAMHVHLENNADPGGGGHATALLRVREAFDDARTFRRSRAAWERNQFRPFAPSRLDLEALVAASEGKLPVVFHVDRAADIESALSLARELGLRPVIAGGAEAWRVAATLAAARVPVIVYPLSSNPETFDQIARAPTPPRASSPPACRSPCPPATHTTRASCARWQPTPCAPAWRRGAGGHHPRPGRGARPRRSLRLARRRQGGQRGGLDRRPARSLLHSERSLDPRQARLPRQPANGAARRVPPATEVS